MPGREYQVAFSIGAKLQGQFSAVFGNAQKSVAQLQKNIESLNKKQGDINAYQKQQQAAEKTRAKLDVLRQQYQNLRTEMDENGRASATMQNAMLQKQLQIERTTAALESQETKLAGMGNALQQAGVNTQNLAQESKTLSAEMESLKAQQEGVAASSQSMGDSIGGAASSLDQLISAVGVVAALTKIYSSLNDCAKAAIAFEVGMAGVQRTVGGSDEFLDALAKSFKQMSTEIPITTQELAQIATTAGQLGIAQGDVEKFTTVMAKLSTTTDLTAENAATLLAQFSNITGTTDFERLGSTIADLGDSTATTASKIVEMSQGIAAAASMAGMKATDILGISAAVGSLGIEAQAGSTAMSTLISNINKATETGEKLNEYAAIANMTSEEFKVAWGENAAGALAAFIQGLNDTERNGKSAVVALDELGITNVRQTKAILGLASAGDLLSSSIVQANAAWEKNTALGEKSSIMYETTQAKITMMESAANNLKIAIGDALTPAIGSGAEALTGMLKPITEFIEQNPALVTGLTATVGVFAAVTGGILAFSAAAKVASAAAALMSAAIPGLNIVLGVTAGVAALTGLIVGLSDAFGAGAKSEESFEEAFGALNVELKKQDHIRALCAEYQQLKADLHNAGDEAKDLTTRMTELGALKDKASAAQAELNAARTLLADMEKRGTQLTARINHAGTEFAKNTLRTELEAQNNAISAQRDKVNELEAAYSAITAEYTAAESAANELAAKEQRLSEIKAELSEATGGVISATAEENAELEKQIAYQKELAEARMAEIRLQARNAAAKNAQSYADAVRDATASQYSLNKMAEKTARLQEIAAEGADGVKTRLNAAAKGLLDLSNQGIFDGDQVKAYKTEISELWSMLTGQGYDYRGLTPLYADIRNLTDDNFNYAGQRYDEMMISMGADIEQYEAALASANAVQQQFVATLVSGVKDGGMSVEDMETLVRSAFADVVGGAELAEQVILQVRAAMEGTADAAEEMGESTATSSAQVEAAMQPILDRMTQLGDAYSEVYEAAYNSMSGQFKLFEEAPEIVEGSIDDMIKALYSQQEYMWEYSHNLQEAQKMGLSEGLLAQLSDGSKESAAYLATIVNQGATKIDELNAAFEGVEKGKETFAGTVAEMQTNFDAEMQKLTDTLKATVEDMDLSTEAANAGAATVQAFADAASGKSGAVAAAFRLVSKEAKLALGVDLNANGYASGTGSAAPGWAMVGENGPEMVWMNGGERVLNAADTNTYMRTAEPALSSSGAHIEIKPVYNIDGSVDSAHLRDVLEEQTNIIRDMVEDAMSEIAFDRGRSVYSR